MSDKFTAGEWSVSGKTMVVTPPNDEISRRIKAGEVPFDCKRIAITNASHYIPQEEAEANARLMAASPDLLEACREIIRMLEPNAHAYKAGEKARDAIAKATEIPR